MTMHTVGNGKLIIDRYIYNNFSYFSIYPTNLNQNQITNIMQ